MAKPWAKNEVGYMRHPKFLALSGNAIALWHEGKDFCSEHQTDGFIPQDAIRSFRFRGKASIGMLTTSCGPKGDGTPYAPLWEPHPVGFKMHDYLDHNDCRDAVLARIERADAKRDADRERQAEWRAKKRDNGQSVTRDKAVTETALSRSITETETATESETPKPKEQVSDGTPRSRPAPIVRRRRLDAAFEWGRLYVPQRAHDDLVALRNNPDAEAQLWPFYERICEEWTHGAHKADNPGSDLIRFWKARYDEQWPPTITARPDSRLPAWAQKAKAVKAAQS